MAVIQTLWAIRQEMTQQEVKHALTTIRKRAREASRLCSYDNCENTSIQSHLLQKNGILNQISDRASLAMELAIDAYKPGTFVFKPVSIGQAFTFPGFCNEHDTSIFKEIEQDKVDYTVYRNQMLFSYRAIVNEKYKKVVNLDVNDRILNSFKLKLFLNDGYLNELKESKKQESLAIEEFKYYEEIFLRNIKNEELRDFEFMTFDFPKVEICASGVFTYETTREIDQLLRSGKHKETDPFTHIYFNLLPTMDKSIVIMGCLKERKKLCWDYIASFKSDESSESLKKISDLFLCQLENWLCSTDFYKQKLKSKESEITKITHDSIKNPDERRSLTFNLFEDVTV
jgi:hypothetical protein